MAIDDVLRAEDYATDLAYVHDRGFGDFARRASQYVLTCCREKRVTAGRVVDLGCGSGVAADIFCRAGFAVYGVDASEAMLVLARERAGQATLQHASLYDADIPPCQVVVSLGECLCYLSDGQRGDSALEGLFDRVYRALSPGGLFIFDVITPSVFKGYRGMSFREGRDWTVLVKVLPDDQATVLRRRIVTFRLVDGHWRRSVEVHRQQTFDAPTLARRLRRHGFTVQLRCSYGELPLLPGRRILLARKTSR